MVQPAICESSGMRKAVISVRGCEQGIRMELSGCGGVSRGHDELACGSEHALGVEGGAGAVPAPEELEELARNGGHGFGAGHAGATLLVVVGAEESVLAHERKHGLVEDLA